MVGRNGFMLFLVLFLLVPSGDSFAVIRPDRPSRAVPGSAVSLSVPYKVTVDYTRSLLDMYAASATAQGGGSFDDYLLFKEFYIKGNGKVESNIYLLRLNKAMTCWEVLKYMDEHGLQPGQVEHFLVFGEQHVDQAKKSGPIIMLTPQDIKIQDKCSKGRKYLNENGRDLCEALVPPDYKIGSNSTIMATSKPKP